MSSRHDHPKDCWQLKGHSGALNFRDYSAQLDLRYPHQGLSLTCAAETLAPQMLYVRAGDEDAGAQWEPSDAYLRGPDLVVAYQVTPSRPFRVQIYWRLCEEESSHVDGVVLDAVVSLQTSQWEAYPTVVVGSALSTECGAIAGAGKDDSLGNATIEDDRTHHPTLVRLASGASYVEARGRGFDRRRVGADSGDRFRCESICGPQFMERGVIRRLTLRAGIVAREGDEKTARDLGERLQRERPTLTA